MTNRSAANASPANPPWPRIALFVLEALPNARAVRRFVDAHHASIALVGLSNAERPATGGLVGQVRRHLARSGPAILPYLAINFGLPDLLMPLAPLTRRLGDGSPGATPLTRLCLHHAIPTMRLDDVNDASVAAALHRHGIELIVTYHFDQILADHILAVPPLGGINLHPSLLPRHRGPVPTIHAVAEGEGAFGVTVHRLTAAIDAGAVLAQEAHTLAPGISATGAAIALHERGRSMLALVLDAIARAGRVPEGQHLPVLPYRGFPDRAFLAAMRRRGARLTDWQDVQQALVLSTRG